MEHSTLDSSNSKAMTIERVPILATRPWRRFQIKSSWDEPWKPKLKQLDFCEKPKRKKANTCCIAPALIVFGEAMALNTCHSWYAPPTTCGGTQRYWALGVGPVLFVGAILRVRSCGGAGRRDAIGSPEAYPSAHCGSYCGYGPAVACVWMQLLKLRKTATSQGYKHGVLCGGMKHSTK